MKILNKNIRFRTEVNNIYDARFAYCNTKARPVCKTYLRSTGFFSYLEDFKELVNICNV